MMAWFGFRKGKEERALLENPTVRVSDPDILSFFGLTPANLPAVTIESAMSVPAVMAAVLFLSRTLASLPLQAFARDQDGAPKRLTGKMATVLEENPNPEMDRSKFARYFWQQVFTHGRGLAFIERAGSGVEALWPMDPAFSSISRIGGKLVYAFDGRQFDASDVIDIAFFQRSDLTGHRGPIAMASKAIQLALAMNDYGSNFFAGGGIPPLAMEGPMSANADTMKKTMNDVGRAIDLAKQSSRPVFQMPPGYKISQIGFDPEKGQMTEARLFQIQEIARVYQIPPTFLQDLSRATYSNVEQNDLHFVKHLVSQWAIAFEGEMNLKIFGRLNGRRYVRHDLDGLMRGDMLSRMDAFARAINTAQVTPDEVREIEGRAPKGEQASELHMQGATMPITGPNAGKSGASNVASGN